ncbi:hypothetical protein RND81_08G158600 [Saponaria officinalis]|uniref:Aminotransferase-like plant mobile domain-containing protein n=1 Tax=Saponaria officinalis TaxID=3572 RepID=A0AAW1J7X1_SAPOF
MALGPEVIDYEGDCVRYGEDVFRESCFFDPKEEHSNFLSPGIVGYLKRKGYLPREAIVFVPTEPIVTSSWTSPGWFCIHEIAFKTGFKIPSPGIYRDTISALGLAPNQLMPSCWKLLYGVSHICERYNIHLESHDIINNYYARWYGKGRVIFRVRHNCPHLVLNLDSAEDHTWRSKFMFIKKSSSGDAGAFIPEFLNDRVGDRWRAYQCEESNERVQAFLEYAEEERSWSNFSYRMFSSRMRTAPLPVIVGSRVAGLESFQAHHNSVLGMFYSMRTRIQMMRTSDAERRGWDLSSEIELFKHLFPNEAIPGGPGVDRPQDFADSEEDEDPQSSLLPPGVSDMEDYDEC